jgi:hypothetical protein
MVFILYIFDHQLFLNLVDKESMKQSSDSVMTNSTSFVTKNGHFVTSDQSDQSRRGLK